MQNAENDNADKEIITMYAPIFREKLTRLEAHGQENTDEADELRAVLERIDRVKACATRELSANYTEAANLQNQNAA